MKNGLLIGVKLQRQSIGEGSLLITVFWYLSNMPLSQLGFKSCRSAAKLLVLDKWRVPAAVGQGATRKADCMAAGRAGQSHTMNNHSNHKTTGLHSPSIYHAAKDLLLWQRWTSASRMGRSWAGR